MQKLKVFIGSSKEELPTVRLLTTALKRSFEPKPWDEELPDGMYTLDSLVSVAQQMDLAIFVFAGDDTYYKRDEQVKVPRDNVVLEYGLFLGMLSRERVSILRDARASLPTDLDGLFVRTLPRSSKSRRDAVRRFVVKLRENVTGLAPSVRMPLKDSGLGVANTLADANQRLMETCRKLAAGAHAEFLELDSNKTCIDTYIEALKLVRSRFWTTTFISSGFWIHSDRRIIAANSELLKRLSKGHRKPNTRRLFLVEKNPYAELNFIRGRLIHLRQQQRDDEARELESQLSTLRENILKLVKDGCAVRIVEASLVSQRDLSKYVHHFDPGDSEIAIYDEFRVDIFSGGRRGRIDDVRIYGKAHRDYSGVMPAAVGYFDQLWDAPEAVDAGAFLRELHNIMILARRHISYTANWLARFEYRLTPEDEDLKLVERERVEKELRRLSRWGKVVRYLDIGTCTARYPIQLRDAVVPEGEIVGIDNDEDCVAFARANVARETGSDKRIRIMEGDFLSMATKLDVGFDLITCMLGTLSHFGWQKSARKDAIFRMRSLMTRSGVLILTNWSASACDKLQLLGIYDREDQRRLARWTPRLKVLERELHSCGLDVKVFQPDPRIDLLVCQQSSRSAIPSGA